MTIIFPFLLSIFTHIIFPGYTVGVQDQKIYIPLIEKIYNPNLFNGDMLTFGGNSFANYSIFGFLIVFLMKNFHADLYVVLFGLSIITRFIFFASLSKIVLFFTKDNKFNSIAPIFIFGLTVYGTATLTFDTVLLPRTMGITFAMLFLSLYLNDKIFLSIIALGLSIVFHPATALFFLIYLLVDFITLWKQNRNKRTHIFYLLLLVLLLFMIKIASRGPNFELLLKIDQRFEQVLRLGVPYLFITSWNPYTFLWFVPTSIFIFIAWKNRLIQRINENARRQILILFFLPFFLTAFSFFAVDILKMHFVAILQLSRSLIILKLMSTLFFIVFAYEKLKNNLSATFYNFILTGMMISLFVKEVAIFLFLPFFLLFLIKRKESEDKNFQKPLKKICAPLVIIALIFFIFEYQKNKFSIYPQIYFEKNFREACQWVQANTKNDDLFIVFPFSSKADAVRSICQRSVFITYKDGGQMMYLRPYAFEWQKRIKLISESKDASKVVQKIRKEYHAKYVFSDRKLNIKSKLVFNKVYFIYKL